MSYSHSYIMFFERNTNMFTFSGFRLFLRVDTILCKELKSLSEGQLVAQIDKYFLTILANNG